jgi:hypothetical protein
MFILKILKIYVIPSGFRKFSSCVDRHLRLTSDFSPSE